MLDPSLLKSGGFYATIAGFICNIGVLAFQKRLGKLERPLLMALITLMMIGAAVAWWGDRIVDTANGPRHMSVAEWSTLSDKLREFAGQQFTIIQYTDEVEAYQLIASLQSALEKAGWQYSQPGFGERFIGGEMLGVLVVIKDASEKATKAAAQGLVDRLNAKSIWSRWSPEPSAPADRVAIHVFPRLRMY
jgi:hypothetical protein